MISNGHGEDLISLKILEALRELSPKICIEVLPLVGEGKIFDAAVDSGWIKKIGPSYKLPSGGFSNQSFKGLLADISAGLIQNTWRQLQIIRRSSNQKVIVAIGDLLPLFLAWTSRCNFAFIGTPKSDYAWRSGPGWSLSDFYHRIKGTEWDPWEYLIMRSAKCKFVAVRDQLTSRGLRRKGVQSIAPGNPMMDGLNMTKCPSSIINCRRILLLCGSRLPEALNNFNRLMNAIELIKSTEEIAILVALGSEPNVNNIEIYLSELGYKNHIGFENEINAKSMWSKDLKKIFLGPGQFFSWSSWAEIGLANAGTATEQLTGMGIPALSLPGKGPQFKKSFAKRQSRLLGGSVIPCKNPDILAKRIELLLKDKSLIFLLGKNGSQRMGKEGGSLALALLIKKRLLNDFKEIY